jgi:hypothetical protein
LVVGIRREVVPAGVVDGASGRATRRHDDTDESSHTDVAV